MNKEILFDTQKTRPEGCVVVFTPKYPVCENCPVKPQCEIDSDEANKWIREQNREK